MKIDITQDIEFLETGKECSYFDDELCDIRYRYLDFCSEQEELELLERGWRRFGKMHFVPECSSCDKCISMRIDVAGFELSRSQKRVMKKNSQTKVYLAAPSMSYEHINLYDKYHRHMNRKKSWEFRHISLEEYRRSYVDKSGDYARELLYFVDEKLVAVALLDIFQHKALSAIYCYYDHDFAHLSLGKFSILVQIQIAKQMNIPYVYLGYWIQDHLSMGYKKEYTPFEILCNKPSLDEHAIWRKYEQ